jgi:hypothetical protein
MYNSKIYKLGHSHEVFRQGDWVALLERDDYPESPDAWADTDDCFLGRITGYNIGNENWTHSRCEGHTPWGEGKWESAYGAAFPPEFYVDREDISAAVWSEARDLFLDWTNETYLDFDEYEETQEEAAWEFYPVRLRDHGSNGADIVECNPDRANGYILRKRGTTPMEQLTLDLERPSAEVAVRNVLKEWNMYLSGDVWLLRVHRIREEARGKNTEELERDDLEDTEEDCGGYYGYEYAREEALSQLAWWAAQTTSNQTKQEVNNEHHQSNSL